MNSSSAECQCRWLDQGPGARRSKFTPKSDRFAASPRRCRERAAQGASKGGGYLEPLTTGTASTSIRLAMRRFLKGLSALRKSLSALRRADRANPLLRLRRPPALDGRGESREIQARRRETGLARAVFDEAVRYPDMEQRQLHAMGGEQFADARAGAADDGVLLDRDDGAMTRGKRQDQLLVERLDEAHVDQRGIQALGDLAGGVDQRAEGQDREPAAAFASHLSAPQRQGRHFRRDGGPGAGAARVAYRGRSGQRGRRVQHLAALVLVRRRHDHHVGNTA